VRTAATQLLISPVVLQHPVGVEVETCRIQPHHARQQQHHSVLPAQHDGQLRPCVTPGVERAWCCVRYRWASALPWRGAAVHRGPGAAVAGATSKWLVPRPVAPQARAGSGAAPPRPAMHACCATRAGGRRGAAARGGGCWRHGGMAGSRLRLWHG
jgi:hypothetical protein